tara:strand:- start:270 stop:566 length:297 start_codon:yes stop_codon:yes gene_type:complete
MSTIIDAILVINPDAKCSVSNEEIEGIVWKEGTIPISKKDIQSKQKELQAEYDAQEYARNRQAEYPTIAELTVALYDTDDKSAVEAKRAAVKLKYPKP